MRSLALSLYSPSSFRIILPTVTFIITVSPGDPLSVTGFPPPPQVNLNPRKSPSVADPFHYIRQLFFYSMLRVPTPIGQYFILMHASHQFMTTEDPRLIECDLLRRGGAAAKQRHTLCSEPACIHSLAMHFSPIRSSIAFISQPENKQTKQSQ